MPRTLFEGESAAAFAEISERLWSHGAVAIATERAMMLIVADDEGIVLNWVVERGETSSANLPFAFAVGLPGGDLEPDVWYVGSTNRGELLRCLETIAAALEEGRLHDLALNAKTYLPPVARSENSARPAGLGVDYDAIRLIVPSSADANSLRDKVRVALVKMEDEEGARFRTVKDKEVGGTGPKGEIFKAILSVIKSPAVQQIGAMFRDLVGDSKEVHEIPVSSPSDRLILRVFELPLFPVNKSPLPIRNWHSLAASLIRAAPAAAADALNREEATAAVQGVEA